MIDQRLREAARKSFKSLNCFVKAPMTVQVVRIGDGFKLTATSAGHGVFSETQFSPIFPDEQSAELAGRAVLEALDTYRRLFGESGAGELSVKGDVARHRPVT